MTVTELWHATALGETACAALKKNGFDSHFVSTASQATDFILAQVKSGASIGFGGSMTITTLDLADRIANQGGRNS